MSNNSFFGCCNSSVGADTYESARVLYSRNKPSTNRQSIQTLNSPKTSLKEVSHMWASRSMQSDMKQSRSNIYQGRDIGCEVPTRAMNPSASRVFAQQPTSNYITHRQTFTYPVQHKQPPARISFSKERVYFTYAESGNAQYRDLGAVSPDRSLKIPTSNYKLQSGLPSQILQTAQSQGLEESTHPVMRATKKQPAVKISQPESLASSVGRKKIQLGGSKFTVESKDQVVQMQQERSFKLEQSDILVNVFNPTSSQLLKWNKLQASCRNRTNN